MAIFGQSNLKSKNEAVNTAFAPVSAARGLRDQLLYLNGDCVVNNALLVKAYVRAAFGPNSHFSKASRVCSSSGRVSNGAGLISTGASAICNGAGLISTGAGDISHDAGGISHGAGGISHGAGGMSHETGAMSHGAGH